jgi:Meiotically Up-regulated Gene 113 (MUG113) protein
MSDFGWTYVYIMAEINDGRASAPIKVGISRSYHARFRTISTASPLNVEGMLALPLPNRELARIIESCFHQMYEKKRLRLEWFDVDPLEAAIALCTLIKELYDYAGIPENQTLDEMRRLGVTRALGFFLDLHEQKKLAIEPIQGQA